MTNIDTKGDTGRPGTKTPRRGRDPIPATVDWLLGFVTGTVGLVLTVAGLGMYTRVDRALITEVVTAESTEINGLTTAEAVAAGGPFVDWFSAGLAVTGVGLIIAAVGFVRARRRTRRRVADEGGTTATFWASTAYGVAVTALVSFIPGAGIVGGGLAAHLRESGSGTRVGAATGLVGWLLTAPLLAFLAVGLLTGASAAGVSGGGVVLVAIVVVGELVTLAVNVGAGALGGYVVGRFV